MNTPRYVLGTLLVASVGLSAAQAATFGHSRIVSAPSQPLHLEIPVTHLTQQEIESLRAVPAPAEAWREAGMTPPVALESMRLVLLDGFRPDVKVIQLRSDQVSDQPIVDVLLDVRSASGQQRYQVSLLAHADTLAVQRAAIDHSRHPRAIDGGGPAVQSGSHTAAGRQVQVRPGDNMFAIAKRNAVQGVTVYQMMIALQRANPQAFIEDNVNLVKAGATMHMPDYDALTALSDREARRVFQQHAQAFARYRQGSGAADVATLSTGDAAQGAVSDASSVSAGAETTAEDTGGDRLRLSGGAENSLSQQGRASALSGATGPDGAAQAGAGAASVANGLQTGTGPAVSLLANSGAIASDAAVTGSSDPDDQAAVQKGLDESRTRVLELEDNVRHLNEALRNQGHVAAEAALEGARSVSEALKEVMGITEDDAGAASGQPGASGDPASRGTPAAGSPITGQGGTAATQGQSGSDGVAGSTTTSSVKAEKKVSWFQENMLAVIGGGLALIVLIVAWLLRRASAAKRNIFESDSPITDSMVRDKLRDIDLDLDSTPQGGSGRSSS